jgi:hypothetical protein
MISEIYEVYKVMNRIVNNLPEVIVTPPPAHLTDPD